MAQALTPAIQVLRKTTVSKLRELPVRGEILVSPGEEVRSTQEVARANLPGDLYILRLPEKLGLLPEEALKGLRVKIGDKVSTETLICEHAGLFGLFKTRFKSPVDGTVELITERTAHVGVRTPSKPISLSAFISGRVKSVEPEKSVMIEAEAALVQGIFGVGGERSGIIHCLPCGPDKLLEASDLPEAAEGLVLVGGTKPSSEILRIAAGLGAVGMVVGAIDDQAMRGYVGHDIGVALTGDEDLPMTLIVTEGFGSIPMSRSTYALLNELHGRETSINGATQVRAGAIRPEIIVPGGLAGASEQTGAQALSIDAKVRIIRVPYFGVSGKVQELPAAPERIETGTTTRVVRIQLDDGSLVTVPRSNVELVS